MTHLRKIMLEELQRRNYSDRTADGYVRAVAAFSAYFESRRTSWDRTTFAATKRTY